MLLIDGVKYEEWKISNEDELEKMVIEHAQDIFSENSIYFDKKHKLKSLAGVGSIPDGLAIILGDSQQWHIVEVELSSHDPYEHVVPQVDRFINAVDNPNSRNKVVEALYEAVENDEFIKLKIRQTIGQNKDIHKYLFDLVIRQPTITIIIEQNTEQLKEAIKKYTQNKVVEFQTFRRVGAEAVHVHLFEPLHKVSPQAEKHVAFQSSNQLSFDVALKPGYIKYRYIHFPTTRKDILPPSKTVLELDTDIGSINVVFNTNRNGSSYIQKDFAKWFNAHTELKPQDVVRITVIDPMKKYRLEIVK